MSIDLSKFNLYTPKGKTIQTQDLQTYSDEFFWHNDDGSTTYDAPSFGDEITHTENSAYPRSELRECLPNGDDKEANWRLDSKPLHIIYQDFKVECLPKSGKAIVGQVHGEKSEHPPLKEQITNDKIYLQLRRSFKGKEDKPVIIDNYKLQTRIQTQLWWYADGRLKAFVNLGEGWYQVVNDILLKEGYQFDMYSYNKAGDTFYYKVGIYSQNKIYPNDPTQGRGRSTYWTHEIQHLETIPQYEPGQEPPPRTLKDVDNDVQSVLSLFQANELSKEDAQSKLEALRLEAEGFDDGEDKTASLQVISDALSSLEPVTPPTPQPDEYEALQAHLDAVESSYYASLKLLQSTVKAELNKMTTDMKGLTDKDKLASIYTEIKQFKADMALGMTQKT